MSILPSKTLHGGSFKDIFIEVSHSESLNLRNPEQLRLFHLEVSNNQFSFNHLQKFIRKNIGQYVFSRAQIEEYELDDDAYSVGLDALEIMRSNAKPGERDSGNDLGEILLYIFLEEVLGAPKILSKVELRAQSGSYDSECDAIHFLSSTNASGNPYYNIVFGTSSIVGDVGDAIDAAFDRIAKIHSKSEQEILLAENTIFKKDVEKDTAIKIKDLLVPKKGARPSYDAAFGIFLAYDLGLNPDNYSNQEFALKIEQKMQTDIKAHAQYIIDKINGLGLGNYSFYIYFIPLNDVDNDKLQIMRSVFGKESTDE